MMKKLLRVFLLLTPLILVGFVFYQYYEWHPPINPNITQPVSVETLMGNPEVYKAPMNLVINGAVHNKSGEIIYLGGLHGAFIKVNCTNVNINNVDAGTDVYIMGYSFYHEADKYFLATDIHVQVSYSLYLSIPGAIIVLIILFAVFKFNKKDFSFSRRGEESVKNA